MAIVYELRLEQLYLLLYTYRLSKETFEDVQSCAIDWLELVKAVQKQSCK